MTLLVGALQVSMPTTLIIMGIADAWIVFTASGLYLFGFTYLWVGINGGTSWNDRGLGWSGLFVATVATVAFVAAWPVAAWVTAHHEEVTA